VHRDYGVPMPLYAGAYTELREKTLINPTPSRAGTGNSTLVVSRAGNR